MNNYEKPDFWTKKAFSEGYPARSVYKLQEINTKHSLFAKNAVVLDLGAAPGSWTVFILRQLDKTGRLVSVDLNPLDKKIHAKNLCFFQGDLYDLEIKKRILEQGLYDAVLCDAAPPTTGNRIVDSARSIDLAALALEYAKMVLKKGGNTAIKFFQGSGDRMLLDSLKELFTTAKVFKPKACRSESFETYLIGIDKKD